MHETVLSTLGSFPLVPTISVTFERGFLASSRTAFLAKMKIDRVVVMLLAIGPIWLDRIAKIEHFVVCLI
jgi:hypothetical protein